MYIDTLKIKNFRKIIDLEITLNKNINIFIGKNAQGKTSILESIYVLALTKPFKTMDEVNLINNQNTFAKINGTIKKASTTKKLEILLKETNKNLKIDNNLVTTVSKYISNLNVIMFSPEDLDIIKKSPLIRRNLLNIELCQLFPNYLRILNEYNKILKIRNDYIRKNFNFINTDYLDILTDKLIDRELVIMEYREKFIESINVNISNIYKKIMKQDNLSVVYEKSIKCKTKEEIKKLYKDNLESELLKKMTLYGPHRDDLSFYVNNDNLKYFGSQGQQRVAILSFKLAEINIFKEVKKEYPVVLLDDIFSELDIEKKNNLLKFIKSNIQFILTTTDLKNINDKIIDKANIYVIKEGTIKKGRGNNGRKTKDTL